MSETIITIRREGFIQRGWAAQPNYRTEGPDGTRFQNSDLTTLRALLRRRYPGVKIAKEIEIR